MGYDEYDYDKPEDITPNMARERAISAELWKAISHLKESRLAFAAAEKARNKTPRKSYTAADRIAWRLLYDGGMSVVKIAEQFGCAPKPIYAQLKRDRK